MSRQEIVALKRKVAKLESLLLPGQAAVYKAAMAWSKAWHENKHWWPLARKVLNACARSLKLRKGK